MERIRVAVLGLLLLTGLQTQHGLAQDNKAVPNDLAYMTKSVEYAALCVQIYRTAWPKVKRAGLAEKRNWVVVLDVDETVLNNQNYALELYEKNVGHNNELWTAWVKRAEAPPIPGVQAFLDSIRTLGPLAHVAFITDRSIQVEKETVANLKEFGLWKEGDTILTKASRDDEKEARRRSLETGTGRCEKNGPLVIVALFGDNIRDFVPMEGLDAAGKYKDSLNQDPNWGTRYFMLPNPNYGSWVRNYN